MLYRKKPRTQTIIDSIHRHGGLVSHVAKELQVSVSTMYQWINKSPKLQEAVYEARESTLDLAESMLIENIKAGKEASIFFYLKTMGKKRGFVERFDHNHSTGNGEPLEMPPAVIISVDSGESEPME